MKPVILLLTVCSLFLSQNVSGQDFSKEEFKEPAIQYWPRPLWFWNNTTITTEGIEQQMKDYKDLCGYGGFGILPFGKDFKPEYLKEDYFRVYGKAVEKAKELGLSMCLYDEYGFPSGGIGLHNGDGIGRFEQKYPDQTFKRLDKFEETITGPASYSKKIPNGKLMSIVAMEINTLERIELTSRVTDETLKWDAPRGNWKIMIFNCVKDPDFIVDYLDPEAVRNFIKMTHEAYYAHFSDYFGTVITGTFFDEPTMYRAQGRVWTNKFNEKFRNKYGFGPELLYPSLWYDIGPETQSARNYLFGFRAELYAKGFTKEIDDWSRAHGVTATGHQDQEEVANPVSVSGDLMKSFKYLEIPGIDKIGGNRLAEKVYKVVSSSAYNWDHTLVMSETYGAMGSWGDDIWGKKKDLGWNQLFSIAMDQYTKGINMLIPHAVWYDIDKVTFKPELSHRNPLYADSLKVFNKFLSRLNYILQKEGRHVSDIAVLYPIQSLQGDHYLDGPVKTYLGGVNIPNTDYIDVSNWLTNYAGKDFTFIHPEVLDERCPVVNGELHLQNRINKEIFKVLVIPSCKTISITNLKKIIDFYEGGGSVVFTTRLPTKSVETGMDMEVSKLVRSLFPEGEKNTDIVQMNREGGKAILIRNPSGQNLRQTIINICRDFDVDYPVNEEVRYIHRVIYGQEVYFFANIGGNPVNIPVTLRGKIKLQQWNPHTGNIEDLKTEITTPTRCVLNLKPYHSCFWIGTREQ